MTLLGSTVDQGCNGSPINASLSRVRPPETGWRLCLHSPESPGRAVVERYIEGAYARAFHGRLNRHYPLLVALQGRGDQVWAAAGLRLAEAEPLFLEQYLDLPVEVAVSQALATPVARSQIAEVGSLASSGPAASPVLFQALAHILQSSGRRYAVATATRQLRRSFDRLGVVTQTLAAAEPSRLAEGAGGWGSYYQREPHVLLGVIAPAAATLATLNHGGRPSPRGGEQVAEAAQ